MPHLENWKVIRYSFNSYQAPELWETKLSGIVTGHLKKPDGLSVITSNVVEIDIVAHTAITRSNHYTLGEPDADWLKWLAECGYKLADYSFKKV